MAGISPIFEQDPNQIKAGAVNVELGEDDPQDSPVGVTINPDGSVDVQLGGPKKARASSTDFYANLAEELGSADIGAIAEDLLEGIEADEESRKEWLDERAEGIRLLALKIEKPNSGDSSAPIEGQSRVRHPMMLEATLRFQANARGELLPVDGPVKIRDDELNPSRARDSMADALERDMNHYLTSVATEYYPDTDRMFFMEGAGGCGFKKVYRCPIRRRPVSESVDAADLIVGWSATDLGNADRITHRVMMRPSILKRMQLIGAYIDIPLSEAQEEGKTVVDQTKEEITGVSQNNTRPKEQPYTIYECYCLIDVPGYEHEEGGEITGLPLPYKVTIEKTSRRILEIRRNWMEDDELFMPRRRFVKFPYVPGLGFYDLGLIHIMGNTTLAATALWRLMLDAGMFANFPGFLYAEDSGRQQSNMFRVPPGGGSPIKTNGQPIGQIVMPLPYHEPGPATMALGKDIVETGSQVGGVAEIQVGEGKSDAPVGTTIALLEAATKVLDAVHKRNHQAQGEEFQLLKELFKENPEDFWRFNKKPTVQWTKDMLIQALEDNDFVPVADPNTSSHIHRLLRAQAVVALAQQFPQGFNLQEVLKFALQALQVSDADGLMAANQGAPPPDPKAQASLLGAQADQLDSQTKAAELAFKEKTFSIEDQNRDQDRKADLAKAQLDLKKEIVIHNSTQQHDLQKKMLDHGHDIQQQNSDQTHDLGMAHTNAALAPEPGLGSATSQ